MMIDCVKKIQDLESIFEKDVNDVYHPCWLSELIYDTGEVVYAVSSKMGHTPLQMQIKR